MDNVANTEQTKKSKKSAKAVIGILLLLLLALFLSVFLFTSSKLNKISYEGSSGSESGSGISSAGLAAATPVPTISAKEAEEAGIALPSGEVTEDKHVTNILFLGTDKRIPNTSDPGRADSTMLCSINTKTGDVKLVSFERGISVPIPGMGSDLLTHAYHWGGANLSQSLIEQLFLLDLAGYAQVDFDTFPQIIDAIGGVDVELTEIEAAALNGNWRTNARTEAEMQKGVNHLNGKDALAYCRLRYPDDDWARQSRQRKCLEAALKQVRKLGLKDLNSLADTVLPLVHTNLSKTEIASLLLASPKIISSGTVGQMQVPDKNYNNGIIKCNFDYESKKISNFIYGTDYDISCPY